MRVFCRTALCCFVLVSTAGCDLLNAVIGGCDYESDPNCEDPERGQIAGSVTLPQSAQTTSTRLPLAPVPFALRQKVLAAVGQNLDDTAIQKGRRIAHNDANLVASGKTRTTRFRAGEVIVKATQPVSQHKAHFADELLRYLDASLPHHGISRLDVGLCGRPDRCVVHAFGVDHKPLSLSDTAELALVLAESPMLRYAERNLILQPLAVPNDEFYSLQWHYAAIDAQAAWDITTGDPDVIAAIVDTGIILDHPDLQARLTVGAGADLVSDEEAARDGDGRDNNGNDPGDEACGGDCHSFHGSHVAGTIGADTNNGEMVAGISWQGALLPVRVLGAGGGSLSDIADGIYWAAGFTDVEGVSDNLTPADVINMSLGGEGQSDAMDEAVKDAVEAGVIVVVAAGNDNVDASDFTPANSPGAITVASVGNTGGTRTVAKRASYSNFGDTVDIAAPGGEQAEDIDSDGQPDGVLSTLNDFVGFYQGTSMAAPHVAGIAMLLKAQDRSLTQDEVRALLVDSADPNIDCDEGCGAGRVSAAGALYALAGNLDGPRVVASPSTVRVGRDVNSATVSFKNIGTADATIAIGSPGGADRAACDIDTQGGTLRAKGTLFGTVTIARTGSDRGECTITATSDGTSAEVRVVWSPDEIQSFQSIDVGALRVKDDGELKVERLVQASALTQYQYKLFNLAAGNYLVIGLADTNGDGDYEDAEDGIGIYTPAQSDDVCIQQSCGHVAIKAGQTVAGADFVVASGFRSDDGNGGTGTGALGAACEDSSACSGGLYCDTALPGGYCTTDCFDDRDCNGGLCFPLISGELEYQVCLKSCEATADCAREDGYICDTDATCYPG